jgi:hypothetical protein
MGSRIYFTTNDRFALVDESPEDVAQTLTYALTSGEGFGHLTRHGETVVVNATMIAFIESTALSAHPTSGSAATEGARLVALNMALSGTSREAVSNYLRENLGFEDEDLLEEVYRHASRSAE